MGTDAITTASAPGEAEEGVAAPSSEFPEADPLRLASMIEAIAAVTDGPGPGVTRLAFTKAEREAHDLVGGWLEELGLTVRQDAIGNTIAELPGSGEFRDAIGTGSHLDSVPHGGRFDGIAGVVAAVEVARLVADGEIRLRHPLRVVAFAAEEGARFGEPCIGSKAVAGRWEASDLDGLVDSSGVSVAASMRQVGLDPSRVAEARWDGDDWAGFVELHVEQARVLESTGVGIGIVDMVSGSTRVEFILAGRAQHTGGTPMHLRSDALTAASEVVLFAERLAHDPRYRGTRATVGRLEVFPNSITTIPGSVRFVLDLRDIDSDRQRRGAHEVASFAREACDRRGVRLETRVIADSSPAVLPMWLRGKTGEVCEELSVPYRVMTSGASHDAQVVNRVTPTGMVFVPSKAGLSHVPEEWTSATDLARGTTVLARTLQRLDTFLATLPGASQSVTAGRS